MIKHRPMKLCGTVEVQLITFIILLPDGVNGVVHMLGTSTLSKRLPHSTG